MKKILLILTVMAFVSCKNESKSEDNTTTSEKPVSTERTEKQSDGLTLLKGEFIYLDDAAVLQTPSEVYAVVIDDKMHELNEQVLKFKSADTDMVPVEIRGKIIPKPENELGWDYRIEIKEILKVRKPNPEGSELITIGKD